MYVYSKIDASITCLQNFVNKLNKRMNVGLHTKLKMAVHSYIIYVVNRIVVPRNILKLSLSRSFRIICGPFDGNNTDYLSGTCL